jgi:hypothetical protein
MTVSPEFIEASGRAAIRALRGLEQTAIMLEKYGADIFPDMNEQGQKHFGRVMLESAAEAIREAWATAIKESENFPDNPANLIEQRGKVRQALLEICGELGAADVQSCASDDQIIMRHVRDAKALATAARKL